MPLSKKDIYVVRRPYVTNGRQFVQKGTRMRGDDPRAVDEERLLIRADDGLDVEQATSAPGERRSVGRPPKAATKEAKSSDTKADKA